MGQHSLVGSSTQPIEIVGIEPNVGQYGRDDNPKPEVYLPCAQKPPLSAMLAVRTDGNPLSFANAVRGQVLAIDRDQPVSAGASVDDLVGASQGEIRLMMSLLGTYARWGGPLALIGPLRLI